MGIFRKILAEGKDLAAVVQGIKDAVMNYKAYEETQEALFRKELTKVEEQAQKALADIAKVLDKHKATFEAMSDKKWSGQINAKLMECGQAVMGVVEPITTTLAEFVKSGKKEKARFGARPAAGTQDCAACDGTGEVGGDECTSCRGSGMMEPETADAVKGENKKTKK